MPSFFSLPAEIRFQIYRELRSFKSPLIKATFPDDSNTFGYCSFGFQSRILEANRQTSLEAKEVFYGENFWTFFASQRVNFNSVIFQVEPMVLILPYIRRAHIRFSMFHWLFWESCGLYQTTFADVVKANVREICMILHRARSLRTVKIIWTETCTILPARRRTEPGSVRRPIFEVLQPLIGLPRTSELQKSNVMVAYRDGTKATEMERDFSESVDEIIAIHRSFKGTQRTGNPVSRSHCGQ